MQLLGKRALVTGGGEGIGRGIVGRFLEEGALVAVVQRRPLASEMQGHSSVFGIQADLTDTKGLPVVVDHVVHRLGGVDILVNNAGVMFERSVAGITPDEWDRMIALNLRTPLFLTQALLPQFRKAGGGSIINIGSIEGIAANPQHAAYAASKAGIHGMTRAIALDLGADNIRCNAIAPGWIHSELSETYLASQPTPAEARDALKRLHPVGRVGEPRDVGDLAVFLAGDNAGFLTGEVITLDGGRTARLPLPF
ncbi:short-chain dehydrogenase [Arthrobacter sp. AFG7.2]|uniref:SDR family NAD(P)-dependent oxidoreductase n=1 Tax=Arthrobacter sp. AFG7.2 TaxID=1688693 RepID=UPI000C9E95AC|nr:glucose 1-dehydrogenase [Arthrobacter sp. AFG7.2]PNI08676.1 short-chain dehydrogenase [Arthrobacter sp. AFG7.2]